MPIGTLNSVPRSITALAAANTFAQEEEQRRDMMKLNKDFYYDKQEQSLKLANDDQDPHTLNIVKPIIHKRASLLYAGKIVREFDGPEESISFLEQVYADNSIDALLGQVDLNAELTGSAVVIPVEDESKESGIALRIYDASAICPLADEDDPSKLAALSIVKVVDRIEDVSKQVKRVVKQQIWTDDAIVTYEGETLLISETNELGFIPFCNFKGEDVYDQYLGHAPATGVRMLNESINQMITDLGFTLKFQAFTPIAVQGYSGDTILQIHPGRAINLPAGAGATTLSTNPKLVEMLTVIQYLEEKVYETTSVPKIAVVGGGQAKSGKELIIRWFPLLQVFREKANRYQAYELQLANLILRVTGRPELVSLTCNYPEESILPFSSDEDTLEREIRLNVKTAVDEILRRDPTLEETEAEAIVLANRDFNEMMGYTSNTVAEDKSNVNIDDNKSKEKNSEDLDKNE